MFSVWGAKRWWRDAAGQSVVELSLCLPALVFGLIGGTDLARAFALQIAVENGSRAGAEAYAITVTPTTGQAQQAAIDEINRTPTAAATAAMVDVTRTYMDGTTVCSVPSTLNAPCFVNVRVQYTWRTLIPWPFIPTTGTFDKTTSMRTYN